MSDHPETTHDAAPELDLAVEAEHARHHAVENNWFFLCFFSLVGVAVLSYEFTANSWPAIIVLGLLRVALIFFFLYTLFKRFNYIVAAFAFTILFFGCMIWLSLWDSTVKPVGDPIQIRSDNPNR